MNDSTFNVISSEVMYIDGLTLRYDLLSSLCDGGGDAYSLKVSAISDNDDYCRLAFDVTRDGGLAREIFSLLVRSAVTPCTLFDVLEDIL